MYVAVKGGEKAIEASLNAFERWRSADLSQEEINDIQVIQQLGLAVDRVMAEGNLLDPELAALAIRRAQGDLVEAIFLLRAFRTSLERIGRALPLQTSFMQVQRRISAIFKDVPGGQILGPTADYSQRLLMEPVRFGGATAGKGRTAAADELSAEVAAAKQALELNEQEICYPRLGRVTQFLRQEGLLEPLSEGQACSECKENSLQQTATAQSIPDLTQSPMTFPMAREAWLQGLARGDEGFLLALGYSTQRGFGSTHPFVGEIRCGFTPVTVPLSFIDPTVESDEPVGIGELLLTECEMVTQFMAMPEQGGDSQSTQAEEGRFTTGYGLAPGRAERKAMAMALVDRALQSESIGEPTGAPAQDLEFVLAHADNVEASGFVQHLKLPHYVDFQAELSLLRRIREKQSTARSSAVSSDGDRGK
ncbi:MAG: carbon-phosphorus lyase complex subunit PhnI [Burkholderiaceae bacterium]